MCCKKIVAVVTAGCFLFSFIFAQPVKAAVEMHAVAVDISGILDGFTIPPMAGKITGGKYYGSSKVVINIQDLHCNPEVQRNISRIIGSLDDKYKLGNIYIEGAAGNVDTSWVDAVKDKALRKEIVETLVEQGRLTGVEYYAMTHDRPRMIKGIEDEKPFDENIVRLGKILKKKEFFAAKTKELRADLAVMKNRYLNARNRRFNEICDNYAAGRISTEKYYQTLWKYIRDINEHPERYPNAFAIDDEECANFRNYLEVTGSCGKLNYKRIGRQLQELLVLMKQRIPYSAYNALQRKTGNFSRVDELYVYLAKLCKEYHIEISTAWPDLSRFFAYMEKGREINPLLLLEEERKLVKEIHIGLSQDTPELEVSFLADFLGYFEDYLNNRLTAADYAFFVRNFDQFTHTWGKYSLKNRVLDLEPDFALLNEYYRVNNDRNGYFLKNILGSFENTASAVVAQEHEQDIAKTVDDLGKTEVIVVVAGGFHTEGLEKLLDERKVSYLYVTPNVTGDTKQSGAFYMKIAAEQAKILSNALALKVFSQLKPGTQLSKAMELVVRKRLSVIDFSDGNAEQMLRQEFKDSKEIKIENGQVTVTFKGYDEEQTFSIIGGHTAAAGVRIGFRNEDVKNALKAAFEETVKLFVRGEGDFYTKYVRIATSQPALAFFDKMRLSDGFEYEVYEKLKDNVDGRIAGKDAATMERLLGLIQDGINVRDEENKRFEKAFATASERKRALLAIDLLGEWIIAADSLRSEDGTFSGDDSGRGDGGTSNNIIRVNTALAVALVLLLGKSFFGKDGNESDGQDGFSDDSQQSGILGSVTQLAGMVTGLFLGNRAKKKMSAKKIIYSLPGLLHLFKKKPGSRVKSTSSDGNADRVKKHRGFGKILNSLHLPRLRTKGKRVDKSAPSDGNTERVKKRRSIGDILNSVHLPRFRTKGKRVDKSVSSDGNADRVKKHRGFGKILNSLHLPRFSRKGKPVAKSAQSNGTAEGGKNRLDIEKILNSLPLVPLLPLLRQLRLNLEGKRGATSSVEALAVMISGILERLRSSNKGKPGRKSVPYSDDSDGSDDLINAIYEKVTGLSPDSSETGEEDSQTVERSKTQQKQEQVRQPVKHKHRILHATYHLLRFIKKNMIRTGMALAAAAFWLAEDDPHPKGAIGKVKKSINKHPVPVRIGIYAAALIMTPALIMALYMDFKLTAFSLMALGTGWTLMNKLQESDRKITRYAQLIRLDLLQNKSRALGKFIGDKAMLADLQMKQENVPIVLHIASNKDRDNDYREVIQAVAAAWTAGEKNQRTTEMQDHMIVAELPARRSLLSSFRNGDPSKFLFAPKNTGLKIDRAVWLPNLKENEMRETPLWLDFMTDDRGKKVPALYVDLRGVPEQKKDEALAYATLQIVRALTPDAMSEESDLKVLQSIRDEYSEKGIVKPGRVAKLSANVALVVDHTLRADGRLLDLLALNTAVVRYGDIPFEEGEDIGVMYADIINEANASQGAQVAESIIDMSNSKREEIDKLKAQIAEFAKVNKKRENSSMILHSSLLQVPETVSEFLAFAREHQIKPYVRYEGNDSSEVAAKTGQGLNVVVGPGNASEPDGDPWVERANKTDIDKTWLEALDMNNDDVSIVVETGLDPVNYNGDLHTLNMLLSDYDRLRFVVRLELNRSNVEEVKKWMKETQDDRVVHQLVIGEGVTMDHLLEIAEINTDAIMVGMDQLKTVIVEEEDAVYRPKWFTLLSLFTIGRTGAKYEQRAARRLPWEDLPQLSEKELLSSKTIRNIDNPLPGILLKGEKEEITDTQLNDLIAIVGETSVAGIHLRNFGQKYKNLNESGNDERNKALYAYVESLAIQTLAKSDLDARRIYNGLQNGENESWLGRMKLEKWRMKANGESAVADTETLKLRQQVREFLAAIEDTAIKEDRREKMIAWEIDVLKNAYNGAQRENRKALQAAAIDALLDLIPRDAPRLKTGNIRESIKPLDPQKMAAILTAA